MLLVLDQIIAHLICKLLLYYTIYFNFSITEDSKKEKQTLKTNKPVDDDSINVGEASNNDHDDEFVSDLHQASSKDIAEADEAMKKLGLTKVSDEWRRILMWKVTRL